MSDQKQIEKPIQVDAWSDFADRYEKGIGGTTRYVAKSLMKQSPPFSKGSVVLDNACGTGIVTDEVQEHLKSQPDVIIKVYAADAAAQMVQVLNTKVEKAKNDGSWPNIADIVTHVVPAEELDDSKVPSETITHAYMNFGIFFCKDAYKAAGNVYRALAPGGTAFFTTWADLGYEDFFRKTEGICNPGNENFVLPFAQAWKKPEYVASFLHDAGFSEANVEVYQQPSFFRAENIEALAELQVVLFAALIRGPGGFANDDEKNLWKKTLAEQIVKDDHFVQEADGVAIKMLANVAICVK